jgi:hypothetical protein
MVLMLVHQIGAQASAAVDIDTNNNMTIVLEHPTHNLPQPAVLMVALHYVTATALSDMMSLC